MKAATCETCTAFDTFALIDYERFFDFAGNCAHRAKSAALGAALTFFRHNKDGS